MELLYIALAPVLVIALYIYYRDKHESEPIGLLLLALGLGAIITVPIIFVETVLDDYWKKKYLATSDLFTSAAYTAFIVAACTEEIFKFLAVLAFWNNKNFNELFDGIVYAVFISLGFAGVENILYVISSEEGGFVVGIMRALTAVPGHALFAVAMGYHLGLAKFNPDRRLLQLLLAIFVPIVLHGVYDFILMAQNNYLLLVFIPYVVLLWILGFRKMRRHSDASIFKKEQVNK